MTNFERIEKAIQYIRENFKTQPALEEVANHVHLSSYHFQRLFKEWAGISPKKFLQYISIEHAKKMLLRDASLIDTSFEVGLSGTSRLHDLFTTIEGMTPGEFKNGGADLIIHYHISPTPFGEIVIGATHKGVCHLSFIDSVEQGKIAVQSMFPNATFIEQSNVIHQNVLQIFNDNWQRMPEIKLHIKGTPFQLKVWEALLKIPFGQLDTYGNIALRLANTKASRAVGTAVGDNPIAFLIPCHRVIRSTGIIGEYHWGSNRKAAIIGWEMGKTLGA